MARTTPFSARLKQILTKIKLEVQYIMFPVTSYHQQKYVIRAILFLTRGTPS